MAANTLTPTHVFCFLIFFQSIKSRQCKFIVYNQAKTTTLNVNNAWEVDGEKRDSKDCYSVSLYSFDHWIFMFSGNLIVLHVTQFFCYFYNFRKVSLHHTLPVLISFQRKKEFSIFNFFFDIVPNQSIAHHFPSINFSVFNC